MKVAALCVSGRSIYKFLPDVIPFDSRTGARSFPGHMPVVAHPPCRHWSARVSHQASSEDKQTEMQLGVWCVEQVLTWGGCLEQPARSRLFEACNLPLPGDSRDAFLYTVELEQGAFGFRTRKPTWVLIAGVPRSRLPGVPRRRSDGQWQAMGTVERSRTMASFAGWLLRIARESWWNHGDFGTCRLSWERRAAFENWPMPISLGETILTEDR